MKKLVLLGLLIIAMLLMTSMVSARGYLPGVDAPRSSRTFTTNTGVWIPYFSWGWLFHMNYGPEAIYSPGAHFMA